MIADLTRRLGNRLYEVAFPLYRPLYGAFKVYADRAERRFLEASLSAGSVVVDAGANIGIYSQFLARCVGSGGMVHSFEPSPDNFTRLQAAVSALSNVRANQLAVSDTTGTQLLYISDTLNVDHRTYPPAGESRKAIPIDSIRLDDYFKSGEHVDLIKFDIQGYEMQGLRGANRVLTDNPEIILLIELWPYGLRGAGSSAKTLLGYLRQHDFTVVSFKNGAELSADDAFREDKAKYFNLFARRIKA